MKTKPPLALVPLLRLIDDTMESCVAGRLGLRATMDRYLPVASGALGAVGAVVRTRDESHRVAAYAWGRASAKDLERFANRRAVARAGGRTWIVQPLNVAGRVIGMAAFAFPGTPPEPKVLAERVDFVCEQLDLVLWVIQSAALKQDIIERITRALTRAVFDEALHDAIVAFRKAARFDHLAIVYRDDDQTPASRLLYRVYRGGRCVAKRGPKPHPGLERGLRRRGTGILDSGSGRVAKSLGFAHAVSWPLVAGVKPEVRLGEIVVSAPGGLDTFARDLLHVFANAVSQRLVDYNRERRHLAQFFSPEVIDELLVDPDYVLKSLSPRVTQTGILYADINSFTKLCEKALIAPERIGAFVDRWSGGAVRIIWKHGGVFDKMVGDCVIAHFGPPFYRISHKERARAALAAGFDIQAFTRGLERDPEFKRLARLAGIPGLGVAVGVNLCPAAVGLYGPNRDLTAFSRGMNETARLQSHAGFREIAAMESVVRILTREKLAKGLVFKGPLEAQVKNVKKPLRYYLVTRC
jgi:class 3 adenylate cyclase